MTSSTLRASVLPLSFLISLSSFGVRGVLKADGIIRVKGADITTATITVVPGHAPSYSLPVNTRHIALDLVLDDVYLISVAREGCPTKEVYFDTRVPVEMHAQDFDFPFMVSLEYLPADRMFTYTAPVGFVRYVHGLKDFGYETQYIIRVDEEMKERMKVIRETGVDPKVMAPVVAARVVDRPSGAYSSALGVEEDSEGTVAPMVSEVPDLVHVVNAPQVDEEASRATEKLSFLMPIVTSVPSASFPTRLPVRAPSVGKVSLSTRVLGIASEANKGPSVRSSALDSLRPSTPSLATSGSISRSEEVITEARRVTHIVRFAGPMGAVHEYRKVVHGFGGVYYFQDGTSITERAFEEATGDVIVNR